MKVVVRTRLLIGIAGALALGCLPGCMSWTPGWENLPPPRASVAESLEDLMAHADAQFETCASRQDVLAAIAAYERVIAADPGKWVLAQDPHAAGSPARWNLYFQRDARTMLDRIDSSGRR